MATAEQITIKEVMERLGTLKAQMEAQAEALAEERLAAKAELDGVKAELAATGIHGRGALDTTFTCGPPGVFLSERPPTANGEIP